MKQDAFWANDPVAAPARPQPAPTQAPAQFWANDPVAAPAAPRRPAPAGGGRQPARPQAAPAAAPVDEYATPMIRDVQRTAEGTTYLIRPLTPEDTDEKLTAEGRYFNPTTNTWEFPRELEGTDVQAPALETLPMVRPGAAAPAQQEGNALTRGLQSLANVTASLPVVQEVAENPFASIVAGGLRGGMRIREGGRELLGQGVRMLPFGEEVGQGLVNEARRNSAILDALNSPFREANTFANQTGQFLGETAVTAPIGGLVGRGISAGGQGLARVAPRTGQILERIGQSTAAGGFLPSAVRPPAAGVAPAIGERVRNTLIRGAGGLISGGAQTALIDDDAAAAGAAIGALLPTVAARPAKYALNQLLNGFDALAGSMGRARASEIVRQSLGIEYNAAVAALRNAGPDVNAQQALVEAGIEPSAFMGVGAAVRGANPDPFIALEAQQAAARQASIDRLAGGANLTAAQLTQRAEKEALRGATVPMQRAELAAADASGALDVAPVSAALMAQADAPGVGTTNSRVLAEIATGLDALAARRGGVASADDLYAFRKDDLDDIISRSLSGQRGGDITSQAARRSELVRSAQQMLDDAIEAAGGTGWRQYLADYASGSETIRRQAMMGVAARQLRNNPNAFVNLVEGDAPDVVSGVFGGNRIDLANQMNPTGVGPSGMDALTDAARQIRRDERVGMLAGEGRGVAQELLQQSARGPVRRLINLVARSRPGTAAALDFGSMLVDAKVAPQVRRELARAYQSGANMDELLSVVPSATRAQMARNMMNPAFWSHLTGAGVNVMADPPANAMSPPPQ